VSVCFGSEAAVSLRISGLEAWRSASGQKRTFANQENPGLMPGIFASKKKA
jgi:hypothetical protein